MLAIQRIVSKCSSFVRQIHHINLIEQSVGYRSQFITSCQSMASSSVESDVREHRDNTQKTLDDGDDQIAAKRIKTSDNSLENAVGIT